MDERELSADETQEKIRAAIAGVEEVILATNGSHGHPNVRTMCLACGNGIDTMWFVTSLESSKIIELIKSSKAAVYIRASGDAEVRLWGTVAILDDHDSRRYVWKDYMKDSFPGGQEDPNMRVLRFDVISGLFAKDGKSGIFTK